MMQQDPRAGATSNSGTADIVPKVRSIIFGALARPVEDGEDFFASGPVSSLFGMQLITLIETSFGLEICDEDLVLDNFSSIDNIVGFVSRKQRRD
jgi:methoxymalonate biosynthesis acyl carrier protein